MEAVDRLFSNDLEGWQKAVNHCLATGKAIRSDAHGATGNSWVPL